MVTSNDAIEEAKSIVSEIVYSMQITNIYVIFFK